MTEGMGGANRPAARYRAAGDATLISVPLDAFTAVFHRSSGITHLLAEPASEILALLADEPSTLDALLAALGDRYELREPDAGGLAARIDELVEAGLVEVVR